MVSCGSAAAVAVSAAVDMAARDAPSAAAYQISWIISGGDTAAVPAVQPKLGEPPLLSAVAISSSEPKPFQHVTGRVELQLSNIF